jgi:CheY-like chemotaxis protein
MRLLLTEDLKAAKTHKLALKRRGHIVTLALNGEDCLKIYNDRLQKVALRPDPNEHIQPFDAVVLDYDIPKMNGIEVTKEILTVNPHQRVILTSDDDKATSKGLGQLNQKAEILKKPFSEQMLIEKIEDVHIYSALKELNIDIDDIKRAHLTHEQLRKVLQILRKRKRIKPRPGQPRPSTTSGSARNNLKGSHIK